MKPELELLVLLKLNYWVTENLSVSITSFQLGLMSDSPVKLSEPANTYALQNPNLARWNFTRRILF